MVVCESIDCVPIVSVMLIGSLFLLKTMHSVLVSFNLGAFALIHSQMSDMHASNLTFAAERASSLSSIILVCHLRSCDVVRRVF